MENELLFTCRSEFRDWLIENHSCCDGIWMVFGKSGKLETIKPDEALDEALCFGWIDGQFKSIDETRYIKKFTPRRKGSNWSEKNRCTAERLIEQGLMTERGYTAIEQAKKDGKWDVPKGDPVSDVQINALEEALQGTEPALSNFLKMSLSVRKTYTAHYLSAKSEDTRARRLQQIIERLNENKKPM